MLGALFNAFTKGEQPAPPRRAAPFGQALRDALAQRVAAAAGPGVSRPAGPQPAPPLAPVPPPPQPTAAAASRRAAPAGQPAEAGRVTALFANPQSLVAAFIVAEILAPPIALRDPLAPHRR